MMYTISDYSMLCGVREMKETKKRKKEEVYKATVMFIQERGRGRNTKEKKRNRKKEERREKKS